MSDKFKFSEEDRIEIENLAYDVYNLGSDNIIDRIESIIQDRGNSIQCGWIDVEDRLPEHRVTVLTCDAYDGIVSCYYDAKKKVWFTVEGNEWEEVEYWMPNPSAPKQPKK